MIHNWLSNFTPTFNRETYWWKMLQLNHDSFISISVGWKTSGKTRLLFVYIATLPKSLLSFLDWKFALYHISQILGFFILLLPVLWHYSKGRVSFTLFVLLINSQCLMNMQFIPSFVQKCWHNATTFWNKCISLLLQVWTDTTMDCLYTTVVWCSCSEKRLDKSNLWINSSLLSGDGQFLKFVMENGITTPCLSTTPR